MTLRTVFHDVGHGQAVHIFTPNGKVIVIDLGCSTAFSPLTWLRQTHSVIDMLVISHPHGDHIDEFLLIEQLGFTVDQFWRPKWLDKQNVYNQNQSTFTDKLDAYFKMSSDYNLQITNDVRATLPENNGGANIEIFASDTCGQSNINNHSGVTFVEYANSTIMIPGDNEPPSWRELLKQTLFASAMAKTNIFMASHHGRVSGYCSDIFGNKPDLCLVSDGRVQDTDATSRYSQHAQGWLVNHRSGAAKKRRMCLTTRSNGPIDIKLGYQSVSNTPFMAIEID